MEGICWNGNHVPAEAGPPGPLLNSPGERERNAAVAGRVAGSICCSSVQSPTHLSQIILFVTLSNPFNKSERYIFLKNYVHSSLLCWICFCMHLHMSMLHNTVIAFVEVKVGDRSRRRPEDSDLTDKMKRSFFQAAVTSTLLYGCTTWTLTKRLERKLDGNYTRMLRAVLNKSWRQHPRRHQLYGHLLPHHENYTS